MTRNQHYTRAKALLEQVETTWRQGDQMTPAERALVELAQVHALLAGVPARVAGE